LVLSFLCYATSKPIIMYTRKSPESSMSNDNIEK